jgi:hypothetical protein
MKRGARLASTPARKNDPKINLLGVSQNEHGPATRQIYAVKRLCQANVGIHQRSPHFDPLITSTPAKTCQKSIQ